MNVSDPLALVAIEAGLVQNPLQDAAAQGESKLDTQQRSAVIGEPVPVVFCRRDEVAATGGVLLSPPATEARFENNTSNAVTASYHLVLSEGRIGSIQVRDVFQRSCRVGSFTQTYGRRAGTWDPGNFIVDQNRPYRRFFSTEIFVLNTQSKLDKYNAILTATLTDPAELSSYPYNLVSSWDEATLLDPTAPEKDSSWDYDTSSGRTLVKDIKATAFNTPEASFYCGSVGAYDGLSTLSFTVTIPNGFDQWNRQVHCFVRNGIEVPRLIEGTTGSSNNFADLVQWALLNCGKLPAALIDATALTAAANFLDVNNLNCDIIIKESENLADFLAKLAPYFLLAETRNNGKRGLRPLLPVNNDHTIKTTAITALFTFTEEHLQPGSFELSYVPLVDRRPFCVQAVWRQQLTDDFGIIRTSEVRYPGEAEDGPFEQHDLSAFCTREDHAVKVAAYIRARRKHVTHSLRFRLRPVELGVALVPGDLVRVKLQRIAAGMDSSGHDFFYEVTRISQSVAGETTFELTHFPVDSQGRSLVALDVANTTGTGILLSSTKSGVSCDVHSSSDTSVPAEAYRTGTPVDQPVQMPTPQQEAPPAAPTPAAEDRNAAIYFHSVEWDELELVVRIRVAPTGRAAVEGLGSLTATIANGTVIAVDEAGRLVSPQPGGLPTLSFTGTVAPEWSAVVEPNKPARPPDDRIFQGEFRITYSANSFPPANSGYTYRMPINITSTSGGFDNVTILNSGLAVFSSRPPTPATNLLLLHMDGANNSTTFIDSGINGLTVTPYGNAKISTSQSKFGGASGQFDGNGDYLRVTSNSLILGQSDFTIEAWVYVTFDDSLSSIQDVVSIYDFTDEQPLRASLSINQDDPEEGYQVYWQDYSNPDYYTDNPAIYIGAAYSQWNHVAVVRSSGAIRVYVNGETIGPGGQPSGTGIYVNQPSLTFSSYAIGGDSEYQSFLVGSIDELRITDSAVYTGTFTPPTAPFT